MKERKSLGRNRWIGFVAVAGSVLAGIWLSDSFVAAQQRGRGWLTPDPADVEASSDVFLPPDRLLLRQWEKAKALVDDSRWSEAVVLVEELLEGSEDYFFKPEGPAAGKPASYQSVKAEAQKLIGDLPPEGRKAYELQFGTKANQLLSAAATAGDIATIEQVSRLYFHTQAGYQATMILGRHFLDHAQPMAAAMCFERLRKAPAAQEAFEPMLSVLLATSYLRGHAPIEKAIAVLNENDSAATVRLGGKTVRLFAEGDGKDDKKVAWLQAEARPDRKQPSDESKDWALARGNPTRNPESAGDVPLLTPRWRTSTTNQPVMEKALRGIRDRFVEQGLARLPAMQPLAVGNLVLMRTANELLAVDFTTGKIVWPVHSGDNATLEQLLNSATTGDSQRTDLQSNTALQERFWEDCTFGTISSDGQNVYLLDGLAAGGAWDNVGPSVWGRGGRLRMQVQQDPLAQAKDVNKLSAHELKTQGKLKWQVGGQSGEDEPQLAGAFFLGPPLPLDGKLYVLAEMSEKNEKGEIKLCVLDAGTGHLDWSQQLAMVEQDIVHDPYCRLAGCTPSFADGVLVCPTAAGAIVGVDISNHTLLWGHKYDREPVIFAPVRGGGGFFIGPGGMAGQASAMDHWADSNVIIAEGHVLATPVDSNQLFCLNLQDGTPAWKQSMPRGENLYVGGVHEGKTILVGKRQLTAVKLVDGKSAWTSPVAYAETAKVGAAAAGESVQPPMPSGRGYLSGDSYFVPLSSAEVVQVDLKAGTAEQPQGKIVQRAKARKDSSHQASVPGNLICFQGEVISQGVDYLDTFFQKEPLLARVKSELEADPNDAWALGHRAEIELADGKIDAAIADARRAYEVDDNSYNRDLFIEALTAGLTSDFGKHRQELRDLEQLVKLDSERAMFLRVVAGGLQAAGEPLAALDAYVKLSTLEPAEEELEEVDSQWSVLRSRWVQSQFAPLWKAAKPAQRDEINAVLARHLDEAATQGDAKKALRQFISAFGEHASGDRARQMLVERLTGTDTLLERERLLRRLERSSDEKVSIAATLQLATLFEQAEHPEAALAEYRRLQTEFGDKPLIAGKSVREMLNGLRADSPLAKAMGPRYRWREGKIEGSLVDAAAGRLARQNLRLGAINIDMRGNAGPFFQDVALGYDPNRQEIFGRDASGQIERFAIRLDRQNPTANLGGINQYSENFAFAQGHLLVVLAGYRLIALDTLIPASVSGDRACWEKELYDPSQIGPGAVAQVNQAWGSVRRISALASGQALGGIGPCTDRTLCFVRGRDVSAIDPLTGQLLWVRHGIEPGSEVFGDDEFTIVAPPEAAGPAKQALVLRTDSGELVGHRSLPAQSLRWTTYGRKVLAFRNRNDNNSDLYLFDPVKAEGDIWSHTVTGIVNNSGVKGTIVDNETVALLEPSGKFVMRNLADGKILVDEKLREETNLQRIFVLRSAQQDFLVTDRGPSAIGVRSGRVQMAIPQQLPADAFTSPVNGRVYAFDRGTGKQQWSEPATIEQQNLWLAQPAELPVLMFFGSVQSAVPGRQQAVGNSIVCLDKPTGRLAYENDKLQPFTTMDLAVDPENQNLALQWGQQTLTLKFTDGKAESGTAQQQESADKKSDDREKGPDAK
jgi:outer membrane protein assembly factor BamB/tetratricopeptide (TPR) repeat protein